MANKTKDDVIRENIKLRLTLAAIKQKYPTLVDSIDGIYRSMENSRVAQKI